MRFLAVVHTSVLSQSNRVLSALVSSLTLVEVVVVVVRMLLITRSAFNVQLSSSVQLSSCPSFYVRLACCSHTQYVLELMLLFF